MKYFILFFFILTAGITSLNAKLLNKTIATINHKMIYLNQLNQTKKEIKNSNLPDSLRDILYKGKNLLKNNRLLLDYLVTRQLLFNKIKKYNLSVSPSKVNSYVEKIRSNYSLTEGQFKKLLRDKKINYSEYKKNIKNKLEVNQFLRQFISPKVKISKTDIKNYSYKIKQRLPSLDTQYSLLHIVTKNKNFKNTNFTPWLKLTYSEMSKKMRSLIKKLNKTKNPQFIKINKEYHLVKIQSISKVESTAYKIALNKIKTILFNKKFKTTLQNWIKKEKKDSLIKIFL
ncbi:MAG: hypothetical protein HAW60_00025 [Bdellovibrionales bacterium]|nr:hypothetical protein [Bdellovibrionales bacterium]